MSYAPHDPPSNLKSWHSGLNSRCPLADGAICWRRRASSIRTLFPSYRTPLTRLVRLTPCQWISSPTRRHAPPPAWLKICQLSPEPLHEPVGDHLQHVSLH